MKQLGPVLSSSSPCGAGGGDVNSTMAATITAAKLRIPVAHVEVGLRSVDRTMPEELNRLVTEAVSDYLFVSEESGIHNLVVEGVDKRKMSFVGNGMIDSLEASRRMWAQSTVREQLGVTKGQYGVMTLHRPSNVDDPVVLKGLVSAIAEVAREVSILFPVHPRTRKHLEKPGRATGVALP